MEETKQQKFVRIAEPRVTRACGAVQQALDTARAAFSQKDKPKKFTF